MQIIKEKRNHWIDCCDSPHFFALRSSLTLIFGLTALLVSGLSMPTNICDFFLSLGLSGSIYSSAIIPAHTNGLNTFYVRMISMIRRRFLGDL